MINDYFLPLTNYQVLIKTVMVLGCWEILGSVIAKYLKVAPVFKIVNWIIGAGAWISFWFLLHWLLPFQTNLVWFSLIFPCLLSGFIYYKDKLWSEWLKLDVLILLVFLLILLLPIIKPLLYQISLPPRVWDDLAYHLRSPAQLKLETTWNFSSVLGNVTYDYYAMMPRFLETSFILLFIQTNSYSPGQLMQFLLVISTFLTTAIFLKRRVSWVSALIFLWLGIYLNTDILLAATTAYIDMGAAALAVLVFISLIEALLVKKDELLLTSAIFTGLALSTKYSTATFVLSGFAIFGVFWIKFLINDSTISRTKRIMEKLKLSIILILIMIFFGLSWYIKNLILTGSPTYPFGSCFECPGKDFLAGWGYIPFTFDNWLTIITQTFWRRWENYILVIIGLSLALILAGWQRNKSQLIIITFSLLVLLIEVLIDSRVSLYGGRFFSHWRIIITFLMSLTFSFVSYKNHTSLWFGKALAIIIWCLWFMLLQHQLSALMEKNKVFLGDMKQIDATEQYFVRQTIDMDKWLSVRFSDTYQLITWCSQQSQMTDIYTVDPEIIWNWDGLARAFFINCRLRILPFDSSVSEQPIEKILEEYQGAFLWSKQDCTNYLYINYPDSYKLNLAAFNHELVCKSKAVNQELYQLP